MSRKDYELIARVLRNTERKPWSVTVTEFASTLARTNPNFNIDKFLKACNAIL